MGAARARHNNGSASANRLTNATAAAAAQRTQQHQMKQMQMTRRGCASTACASAHSTHYPTPPPPTPPITSLPQQHVAGLAPRQQRDGRALEEEEGVVFARRDGERASRRPPVEAHADRRSSFLHTTYDMPCIRSTLSAPGCTLKAAARVHATYPALACAACAAEAIWQMGDLAVERSGGMVHEGTWHNIW